MGTGLTIVVIAVVLALGFGLYRARTDGRFKSAPVPGPQVVEQPGGGASPVVEQRAAPATSGRRDHSPQRSGECGSVVEEARQRRLETPDPLRPQPPGSLGVVDHRVVRRAVEPPVLDAGATAF